MKDTPRTKEKENAPDIVLRDGNLRSATWLNDGEYGPLSQTKITKIYRGDDGEFKETSNLGSKDLLRAGELARETYGEVLQRQREHALERNANRDQSLEAIDWQDEDQRRDDIQRERFKSDRRGAQGNQKRSGKRDRTAR